MELSIVIPAFNEEHAVADVVTTYAATARAIANDFEIVVCDDGSDDGTAQVLEGVAHATPEVRLLRNETNLGIPATMKRLYGAAVGEWIYFAPADGQVPAEALERMWAARHGAALVVGRRVPRRDPASRVLMAQLYSTALRILFTLPVHDVDSVKLYSSADLRNVPILSETNFFEAEILIRLCSNHRIVREVVIPHRPRVGGRAKGVTALSAALALRDVGLFALRMSLPAFVSGSLRPVGRGRDRVVSAQEVGRH